MMMKSVSFRAGVGALIIDNDGLVLAFQRSTEDAGWQLPQGGMEPDESPLLAVYREIYEETGISQQELQMIGEYPQWLAYEFPRATKVRSGTIIGQVHRWFFFRFVDVDVPINLDNAPDDEFQSFEWITMDELISRSVDFKRAVYTKLGVKHAELCRLEGILPAGLSG